MKKFLLILYFVAPAAFSQITPIKVGSSPNNEDGDTPKTAWEKQNANNQQIPPVITLKSFNPVGDGVTDDTAALQAWANAVSAINGVGLFTPAKVRYNISSEIDFTNTARIMAGVGGTVYANSAFSPTHCLVCQTTAGQNGFVFNNYNDAITLDGIFITNSAPNNTLNINSCGFLFTGAVGAHISRITQCGAANFGRGFFSVDLAACAFSSIAGNNNQIGIEVTNILNTGNYPITINSSIFSGNTFAQVVCSGTNVPFLVQGCIITPTVVPSYGVVSYSRSATLIDDQFLPIAGTNIICQTGGTISLINCTTLTPGGNTYYPIVATNASVFITGTLGMSNTLDGSSVFLFGSASKLRAFPDEQFTKNDGSGNLSTNISTIATANGIIPGVAATLFIAPTGNDGTIWNSNKVSYWVTATKTNLINDGR
jgi:hypothetical protein